MMKILLLFACSVVAACTGTASPRPDVPRPKPVEAMQPEPRELCQLRPEFDNLELQDQLAMLANCHAMDAEKFRRLERKHLELADWIKAGK